MKTYLIAIIISTLLSILSGVVVIPLLKRLKAGQPILKYVEAHKEKNGTPTMGGLFFIVPSVLVFFLLGGSGRMAIVAIAVGLAFMIVGFLDDFLKIKLRQNEGLKAYQKIVFQLSLSILVGVFCYLNGITIFYIPLINITINLGVFTIPIVALIFVAVTNSVNLTDGLDGLSSSVSIWYILSLIALCIVQLTFFGRLYLRQDEYDNIIMLSCCLVGGILGFLFYNTNKAKVFMGDTGSLALGGFIGALTVFTSNAFYMPIIGICFVVSSLSVILQVLHYKRTRKRVFLMAPFHHHLQMKGYTESQICYFYSLITVIMGVLSIIFYF